MYEYGICAKADKVIFDKQCIALENNISGIIIGKVEEIDIDGHMIQHYTLDNKRIEVHLDKYLNEVYVKSEIELTQFFKN